MPPMTRPHDYELCRLEAAAAHERHAVETMARIRSETARRIRLAREAGATWAEISAAAGRSAKTCRWRAEEW